MNRLSLITTLFMSVIICISCDKEPEKEIFIGISDITFENYPKVDGSTSSSVLNTMVACKLLGVPCKWMEPRVTSEWKLSPEYDKVPDQYRNFFYEHIKSSRTHGAFINLIDGEADIIVTHRTISPDEKEYAESLGVSLIETSIASDAFVFVVNKNNPVKSLTVEQVQKIYTGEITNWSQVGGKNEAIKIFTRPRNSGSEEVFRELVMEGLEPAEFPETDISGMLYVFYEIFENDDAICYTFNTYKNLQARIPDNQVPKIAINGIFPDEKTIKDKSYPFIPKVHVAIRSDLDHNSMAYKLYEWLQSDEAKPVISESGFLPE